MIYRHFESKDQLFFEAVVEPLREAVDDLVAATAMVDSEGPLDSEGQQEKLQALYKQLVSTLVEVLPLLGLVLFGDPKVAQRFYREHLTVAMDRLAAWSPPANTLDEWLAQAEAHSPELRQLQARLESARLDVEKARAGHLPTLDAVAQWSRSDSESVTSPSTRYLNRTVGVQLNVPLYSGGGVSASVKQAVAEQQRAEEDLRNERENVEVQVQKNYLLVANGAARVQAYRRAAESSQVAYNGAVRAQEAGMGTTADVLDAQTRLFAARRDLAFARYDYLAARLRLKANAGLPLDEVTSDIDRLLPVPVTTASKQP